MVLCQLPNGQALPDPNCNLREKPVENRLCLCDHYNWHVGPWKPVSNSMSTDSNYICLYALVKNFFPSTLKLPLYYSQFEVPCFFWCTGMHKYDYQPACLFVGAGGGGFNTHIPGK